MRKKQMPKNLTKIINQYIENVDKTMQHLEKYGDIIYTPHEQQLKKIIIDYNEFKKQLGK
jgi:uncharacterized protein YlbG (UPF0298 family)